MNDMKYSVLMSVYYKEKPEYLRASIISMLQQSKTPDEMVIVKDGPLTDELERVLAEFNENEVIKIVALEKNVGLGKALDIGISECRNEIIARMDSDDISRRDRCEVQLNLFIKNESLSILSSWVAEFESDINNINSIKKIPARHEDIIKYSKRRNPFNHPSVMFKKEEVEKAGGYKHFDLFEDYYLWIRMILNGAVCENVEEPLLFMRANESMFKRRGGLSYIKSVLKFKWHIFRIGYYSFSDFVISTISHCFVSIIPNRLRIIIYRIFLRAKI